MIDKPPLEPASKPSSKKEITIISVIIGCLVIIVFLGLPFFQMTSWLNWRSERDEKAFVERKRIKGAHILHVANHYFKPIIELQNTFYTKHGRYATDFKELDMQFAPPTDGKIGVEKYIDEKTIVIKDCSTYLVLRLMPNAVTLIANIFFQGEAVVLSKGYKDDDILCIVPSEKEKKSICLDNIGLENSKADELFFAKMQLLLLQTDYLFERW